ncbi:MAG: tetratricopeptide repeat protein, partial [Candidatus Eisenbacteria bacterium]
LELRPGWPDAMNNLAKALALTGRGAEAVRVLEELRGRNPRYALAYASLGANYFNLGDPVGAERVLRQGLAIAPENAQLHFTLALVLKATGRIEEALRERERAVTLDPAMAAQPF